MNQSIEPTRVAIQGMTCGHCRAAVEKAIREVPGVTGVQVDLASNMATVSGHHDYQQVVQAVRLAGYEVSAASRD